MSPNKYKYFSHVLNTCFFLYCFSGIYVYASPSHEPSDTITTSPAKDSQFSESSPAPIKETDAKENHASLNPFVATYMVSTMGLEGLNVTNSLSLNKSTDNLQEYHFKSYSMPVGLLAFTKDDTRNEQSKGHFHAGQIQPEYYSFLQIRDDKTHRHVEIKFDWPNQQVTNDHKHKDSKWTMAIPPGTVDKLSYQLSLMLTLSRQPEKHFKFNIADGGKIKQYEFKILGRERVYTSPGSYKALKIEHQRYQKDKTITLWCAPELNYLPVKIIQVETGKPTFTSTLISYQEGMSEN